MNSIHRFVHDFVHELTKLSLADEGISSYTEKAEALFQTHFLDLVADQISEMDDFLASQPELRSQWRVEKGPVERTLETKAGTLQYSRRYYRHRETKQYCYLLDNVLQVSKFSRVDDALMASLASSACSHSYQAAALEEAGGRVSRTTVMHSVRSVQTPELSSVEPRRVCTELHLQADEDHVALQQGRKKSAQVRLVAIHERKKQVGKDRHVLPERELMSSVGESPEAFWWRVLDRLDALYAMDEVERIYLHGDGASWIRKGLEILPRSIFILDGFHLERAISGLCGGDPSLKSRLRSCLHPWDDQRLCEEVQMLIDSSVCDEKKAQRTLGYFLRQREGIENHYGLDHGGSCAEGLISHVLSKRFSRDPMGWSTQSLRNLSALRVFLLNGGVVDHRLVREAEDSVKESEEWATHLRVHHRRCRKDGMKEWSTMIPGSENSGGALGHWMKGIQRGGFIH